MQQGDLPLSLHPPLVVKSDMGQCAVSPTGRVKPAEVDQAIGHMLKDGTVNALVARYR